MLSVSLTTGGKIVKEVTVVTGKVEKNDAKIHAE